MTPQKLLHLGRYQAPKGENPPGIATKPGTQKVEVLIGGQATFEVNGKPQVIVRGAILWHQPGEITVHQNHWEDPYECVVLVFGFEGKPQRRAPRYSEWRGVQSAREWGLALLRNFHRDGVDQDILKDYAYHTLLYQAQLFSLAAQEQHVPRALQQVLDLLDQGYTKDLHLSALAAHANISVPHLHLLFRTHLETSPHQYIIEKRLQRARRDLVTGDTPIKQVAASCGIADPANFSKAFKKRFLLTPAAYRKKFYGRS